MNKAGLKLAVANGADLKKLESIDKRLGKLLKDCAAAGISLDVVDAGVVLCHSADRKTTLLGTYPL